MSEPKQDLSDWETQEQVSACLSKNMISRTQVNRWRSEGLLPDVQQVQAYRSSTVRYPLGTCAQIEAAARMFKQKNRIQYVGWMLWWEGFPVDEKYWRPDLLMVAKWVDRFRGLISLLMDREGESRPTFPEQLATANPSDQMFSHMRRRLNFEECQSFFRSAMDVASGAFGGFNEFGRDEDDNEILLDEVAMVKGLDLGASTTHSILGQRLKLKDGIGYGLKMVARALGMDSLSNVANGPDEIVFKARDDVRNALRTGATLYEAFGWILGRQAFGLRFMNWMAKKNPPKVIRIMVLGFALLRRIPNYLLSSDEILKRADEAERLNASSKILKQLFECDPRFKEVLDPKRIREAWRDQSHLKIWEQEFSAAAKIRPQNG